MADDRTSLSYDRTPAPAIPRWQFRLLFAFVLLNLAITIQSSYAPGLAAAAKERWARYQYQRDTRALYQQVSVWSEPPGTVVWDDNPDTAAKLLSTAGYAATAPEGADRFPFLAVWPRGARATVPRAVDDFHRRHFGHPFPNAPNLRTAQPNHFAPALVHRLKSPSGEDRLVYVFVEGRFRLSNVKLDGHPHEPADAAPLDQRWTATAEKTMVLAALTCPVGAGGTEVDVFRAQRTALQVFHMTPHKFTWDPPAGDRPAKVTLDPSGLFRFYAGQTDPSDPSRFTIKYDVDGGSGTVHGRLLADDTVEWKPTTGLVVGSRWFTDGVPPGTHPADGADPASASNVAERMRQRRQQDRVRNR